MNLGHRNTHRTKDEEEDAGLLPASEEYSVDDMELQASAPENRQGLKKERWTRIFRIGEEFRGETRIHPILSDLITFHE